MRIPLFTVAFFPLLLCGQLFPGQPNVVSPLGAQTVTSGISVSEATVSGVEVPGGHSFLEEVRVNVEHTWVEDDTTFLISPSGTVLELTSANGGSRNDWRGANLDGSLQVSDPDFCAGESVDISVIGTVPPTATYTWNVGGSGPSITVSPTTATFYSVTITDGGSEQVLDVNLEPGQRPVISATTNNICPQELVQLTASGAGPFTWSTGQSGSSIFVFPVTTTAFNVTSGTGACATSEDFFVNVAPISLDLTPLTSSICSGESVTIEATGGTPSASYAWSTGETTPIISVSPVVPVIYSVTLTDVGCTLNADIFINVNEAEVALGPDQTICPGESVMLTGTGTGPFTWSTGAVSNSITVNPAVTTTYTATSTAGSCTSTDEITLTVIPGGSVSAAGAQTICAGETVTLTASGDAPFSWSTGETGASITVSPTSTETFTVSVGSGTCAVSDDVTVTVNPQPTLDLGSDQTFCAGDATTLTATGSFSDILWDGGEVTPSIPLQASGTVTYTATASNGSCSVTESVTITVNETPVVTTSGDETICAGESVTLTAVGSGPFLWTTGETTPTITVSPTTNTDYFVETAINGCTGFDGLEVNVEAAPTLDLGGDQTFCEGDATTLTATGSFSDILWGGGEITPSIPLQTSGTVTYTATASNGSCSVTESATITVNETPVVTTSGDETICAGESVTLTAVGSGPFLWTTGETTPTITVSPTTNTDYLVETTINGCTGFDGLEVNVEAAPTLDLGGDQTFCEGDATTLTATGSFSDILWGGGEITPSIPLQTSGTVTYTATASNGSCSVTESATITVNETPVVTTSGDETICAGESVTLTAVGSGPFLWTTGETTPTITVSPTTNTDYLVETTINGCTGFDGLEVNVEAAPTLDLGGDQTFCEGDATTLTATGSFSDILWAGGEITPSIPLQTSGTVTYTATASNGSCSVTENATITIIASPAVTASADQTICAGDSVTLTASGTGPFSWSTGAVGPSIRVGPTTETLYSVAVGNANCTATDEVRVSVAASPTITLGPDTTYCSGEASSLTATGSFNDILWATGQNQPTIDLEEGTQIYRATASIGACSATDSVIITLLDAVTVMTGPDQSICLGDSIDLTAEGSGNFLWNTGDEASTIRVAPAVDSTFIVTAGTGNCTVRDTIIVTVLPLPTADLGADLAVCIGSETTLANLSVADNYRWSTGATAPNITVTVDQDTTYFLEVTTNGCSAEDTITLTALNPQIDLGPDRTVCPGDSVIITAPAAASYVWNTGFTGATLRLAPEVDTTLFVAAVINGCTVQDTVVVNVTNDLTLELGADRAICPGDSVTLVPLGSGPFAWSTGETAASITVGPTITTRFGASIGTGNCAVTDSITVLVQPAATVALGADQTLCAGEETTVVSTGNGATFSWSTGEVTPQLSVTPSSTITLGVEATTAAGCTATDSVELRVITPTVSLAEVPVICPGDSVTLMASGAENYAWNTGATTANLPVAPTTTTTYRVTGSTEACPVVDSVTVTVRPREEISISGDALICRGAETTLLATSSSQLVWNEGSTVAELLVQPDLATTYFAVAGAGNCADTAFFTVDFFPEINIQLPDELAICQGASTTLLAAAGTATLAWSDGDFAAERVVQPTQTTTYRISATENGCVAADSVRVTVNALPEVVVLNTLCAPDNLNYTVELSVSGGQSPYLLNSGSVEAGQTTLTDIVSGEAFAVEVIDANGCRDNLIGQEDCGCTEIVLGAPERGCNGNDEGRDLSGLLPAGTPAGTWSVVNPDANDLPAIANAQLSLLGAAPGTYTLQYTPDGASALCLPDYQTTLVVEAPPAAGTQPFVEERCVESVSTIDLFAELEGAVAGGSWEVLDGEVSALSTVGLGSGTFAAAGLSAGDYRFRYRTPEGAGCAGGTAEVTIRLVEITVAGVAVPPNCEEECSGAVVVSAPNTTWVYALDDDIPGGDTRFGELCPGTYTLTTEDDRGCRARTELTVPSVLTPASSVRAPFSIRLGDSTRLELQTNATTENVTWFPAGNCLTPDCRIVTVRPQETTVYRARFTSDFGCPGEAEITLLVDEQVGVYVPNAFSPNGDGINDLLTVYAGDAIVSVENFRLFDRWGGQLVNFDIVPLGDPSFGWDGRSPQGQPLNTGVYAYQFTFTRVDGSSELVMGEVVLLR